MTKILLALMAVFTFGVAGGDLVEIVPIIETETIVPVEKTDFYVGGGYAYTDTSLEVYDGYGTQLTGNNNGVVLDAGYNFSEFFALEGRYNYGFEDAAAFNVSGPRIDINAGDLKMTSTSVFAKPQYNFGDAKVYGLLGVAWTTLELNTINDKIMDYEPSFAWGLGGAYGLTESVELFADYTSLYSDTYSTSYFANTPDIDGDIYSVNVGLNYKF